jgi:hypothetical protein
MRELSAFETLLLAVGATLAVLAVLAAGLWLLRLVLRWWLKPYEANHEPWPPVQKS